MDDYEGVSDRLKRLYSNLRVAEELEVQSFSEHQQPASEKYFYIVCEL
jgi:hypothetical protein